ncbi:MAG: hypothetical protein HYZ35_02965, partial [Chloroflexi bacterium]|nr:hypothetical protein [Chloroflexota bacterium]
MAKSKPKQSQHFHDDGPAEQLPLPTLSRRQRLALAFLRLAQGIARHGADIVAVLLLAAALIAVLALFNLSNGTVSNALADALTSWLGWGAVLAPLSMAVIGAAMLAHNFG